MSPRASRDASASGRRRAHVNGAPVLAGGHVLGVVTCFDLLALAVSYGASPDSPSPRDAWEEPETAALPSEWEMDIPVRPEFFRDIEVFGGSEVPSWVDGADASAIAAETDIIVADVMSRAVISLPPDASVSVTAGCLRHAAVHRVLVMHHGALLGIVSSMDIATAVAEERLVDPDADGD